MGSVPDESAGPGYRAAMILELRQDRLLERPQGTLSGAPPELVRQGMTRPGKPVTIDEYRRSPQEFPEILGVAPAGTRLAVTSIVRRTYPGLEAWYEVTARITTGPYAGRLVSIDRLSAHGADGRTPLVDRTEFAILP
jgi:hypothetical protein